MITKQEVEVLWQEWLKLANTEEGRELRSRIARECFAYTWGLLETELETAVGNRVAQRFFTRFIQKCEAHGVTLSSQPAADHASCPPPA